MRARRAVMPQNLGILSRLQDLSFLNELLLYIITMIITIKLFFDITIIVLSLLSGPICSALARQGGRARNNQSGSNEIH